MLRSVLLPDPERPMMAAYSPSPIRQIDAAQSDGLGGLAIDLAERPETQKITIPDHLDGMSRAARRAAERRPACRNRGNDHGQGDGAESDRGWGRLELPA